VRIHFGICRSEALDGPLGGRTSRDDAYVLPSESRADGILRRLGLTRLVDQRELAAGSRSSGVVSTEPDEVAQKQPFVWGWSTWATRKSNAIACPIGPTVAAHHAVARRCSSWWIAAAW